MQQWEQEGIEESWWQQGGFDCVASTGMHVHIHMSQLSCRLLNVDAKFGYLSGDDSNVLDGTYSPKDALNFVNWFNLPFQ